MTSISICLRELRTGLNIARIHLKFFSQTNEMFTVSMSTCLYDDHSAWHFAVPDLFRIISIHAHPNWAGDRQNYFNIHDWASHSKPSLPINFQFLHGSDGSGLQVKFLPRGFIRNRINGRNHSSSWNPKYRVFDFYDTFKWNRPQLICNSSPLVWLVSFFLMKMSIFQRVNLS